MVIAVIRNKVFILSDLKQWQVQLQVKKILAVTGQMLSDLGQTVTDHCVGASLVKLIAETYQSSFIFFQTIRYLPMSVISPFAVLQTNLFTP